MLDADAKHDELILLSFGRWDLIRFKFQSDFLPRHRDSPPWPPLGELPVLHQLSFLAGLWDVPTASATQRGEDINFSPDFLDHRLAATLVVVGKLNSDAPTSQGTLAAPASNFVSEIAREKGALCLVGGTLGWKDLVVVIRATGIGAARSILKRLWLARVSDVCECSDSQASLFLHTLSSPCVSLAAYNDPRLLERADPDKFNVRLLLDARPGHQTPLKAWQADGVDLCGHRTPVTITEQFGAYDYCLEPKSRLDLKQLVCLIRSVDRSTQPEFSLWLQTSTTVLGFRWQTLAEGMRRSRATSRHAATLSEGINGLLPVLREFRWYGLEPIHAERLSGVLRRVIAYAQDHVLCEGVSPLVSYLLQLASDLVRTGCESLQNPSRGRRLALVEPEEIEDLCNLLEFALRQRTEGLKELLFAGFPSGAYTHCGISKLLAAADVVLKEVYDLFELECPGFTVAGVPNIDGFTSFGPIVTVPAPAVFRIEHWWVLYHEAAEFLDEVLFGHGDSMPESPNALRQSVPAQEFVPDLVTLLLPFQGDLDLCRRMYAVRLASKKPEAISLAFDELAVRMLLLERLVGPLLRAVPTVEPTARTLLQFVAEAVASVEDESAQASLCMRALEFHTAVVAEIQEIRGGAVPVGELPPVPASNIVDQFTLAVQELKEFIQACLSLGDFGDMSYESALNQMLSPVAYSSGVSETSCHSQVFIEIYSELCRLRDSDDQSLDLEERREQRDGSAETLTRLFRLVSAATLRSESKWGEICDVGLFQVLETGHLRMILRPHFLQGKKLHKQGDRRSQVLRIPPVEGDTQYLPGGDTQDPNFIAYSRMERKLVKDYLHKWVGFAGGEFVAASDELGALVDVLNREYPGEDCFVEQVGRKERPVSLSRDFSVRVSLDEV